MAHRYSAIILAVSAALACPLPASAQASIKKGTVEQIAVHGQALEGNLTGDSADRTVFVYLPPSYVTAGTRRYPVVYLLHG